MVNTNSKEVRDKVQAHIRYVMRGDGGMTAFYKNVEYLMNDRRSNPTPYHAVYYMVESGMFLVYDKDIIDELHRWGLTDDRKLWNYRTYKGDVGPFYLYAHLVASNGGRMYEQHVKDKNSPKKTVRKTTTKKTVRRKRI